MTIQALPYVTLLGFLFGSTLIVSRFSVGQFEPTTYIGLRLMMASLGHVAIYGLARQWRWPVGRTLWKRAAILGIFGTAVPLTGMVASLQYQSSGMTALMVTANPALIVLMAHFFLADESLTWRKSFGVALALGGAVMLVLRGETGLPDTHQASPIGYALVLMAMLGGTSMTVYARKYLSDYDSLDVASIRMFTAALVVVPLSLLFVGLDFHAVNAQGVVALIYAAGIGTFAALFLAFYNIKRFGATAAAMTSYIIPIVANVGGVLFLGEIITPAMVVGMAIIIAGIAILQQRSTK